jgi:hypothetical protein
MPIRVDGTGFIGSANNIFTDGSGNVGIGTTTTFSKLTISGSEVSVIPPTTGTSISPNESPIVVSRFTTGALQAGMYSLNSWSSNFGNWLSFKTTSTANTTAERMRIDADGNLLLGIQSPQATFTVYHTSSQKSADFYGTTITDGTPNISLRKPSSTATTAQVYMQFLYSSGTVGHGQINGNGGSQAAFGSYSDIRLKENVENLPNQLDNICSLRPVEFDYIEGTGYAGHQIGFIAQEMQEVYPDAVAEGSDGMLTITGWNKTEARLVKTIQELNDKLEKALARIEALESR